jgi:uroporphyrinogen decarboxylase
MHPARQMGLTIQEYFSRPMYVVEGQKRLHARFGNDILCCYPFAALEMLAWGGEVIYFDNGPPNAGAPIIRRPEDIRALEPPEVKRIPSLQAVLTATADLKAAVGDDIPIAGVVVSPCALPIMQMGFESYLDLIYTHPDLLAHLLRVNSEYCIAWAKAQLAAGASAIMYSAPTCSPTIMAGDFIHQYSLPTAQEVISRIHGPVMLHLASGRGLPLVDDFAQAGFVGMSVSAEEDIGELKAACRGQLAAVGNLNALAMRHWSQMDAEAEVKKAIAGAGRGGGFVLADNHGEIPFVVDEDVLLAVAEAVRHWGQYPLDWVSSYEA